MKLLGYAPDIDQTTPGAIISCSNFIPNHRAMEAAPAAQNIGAAALAAACRGCATTIETDNTFRVWAGTATKLYELSGTTYTDRTRTVGGDYALGSEEIWRFAQFGNATLAVAKSDTLQVSDTTTFANVTGAPKASIVETVGNFVFLFNTNEATYGDSPNRWWCAALGGYTDWTPSIATQCVTDILTSVPGRIYAGKRFGNQVVVYKERGMYIGTYVGAPAVWDFQLIPGDAGCSSQEAVVNIGTPDNPVHIFMGNNDFWRFDGARPIPLGGPLRNTVFSELSETYAYKIKTLHDRQNARVYFYYPSVSGGGAIDKCVVYQYRIDMWGRDDRTVEAVMEYISGGITIANWGTIHATIADIPSNLSFNSSFWTSGERALGFFDATHTLYSLNATPTGCSFTLGDMGDDSGYYLLSRVKPKWLTKPTSATMTNYHKESLGDDLTTGTTTTMGSSRFDILKSARWHRLKFDCGGSTELNSIEAVYQPDGEE